MFWRGFAARIILAIILVAVLVGGGMLLYRSAWTQGFQAGTVLQSGEGAEALPVVPPFGGQLYRPFYPGFGFPFFGLCLSVGFIFLIMFLIGGIFKPWGRRRWAHHGKWGYGPVPPWARDWEEHQRKHAQGGGESEDVQDDQTTKF